MKIRDDNVVEVVDRKHNTSTKREYDACQRLLKDVLANGLTIRYSYDRQGRATSVRLPDDSWVDYIYNASRLKEVCRFSPSGEKCYSHQYLEHDLSGNVLKSTLIGNAGELHFTYDRLGRYQTIESPHWSQKVPKGGYDGAGNLRRADIQDAFGELQQNFEYDDLYQLTLEEGETSHRYMHDSVQNRLEKDGVDATVNALHQLVRDGEGEYGYDPNGNLVEKVTKDGVVRYHYDALDRLIAVTEGEKRWEYAYDAFHRRLSKTCIVGEEAVETIAFLYQGQNEIGAVDVVGKVKQFRVLGVGRGAEIGAAIAIEVEDNVFAPVHDLSGNVVCLLDYATGDVAETYRYGAFGEHKAIRDIDNPWCFSSKRYDDETRFFYFGRRYYDPRMARWVTSDPLGYQDSLNLYAYVKNSPLPTSTSTAWPGSAKATAGYIVAMA